MAKFTTKKKLVAIGESMRTLHILARAIKLESTLVKENVSLIADPNDAKAFKEMVQKCSFYSSRMDKLYGTYTKANRLLKEEKGEVPLDELSLRVLEAVEVVYKQFLQEQQELYPIERSPDYGC